MSYRYRLLRENRNRESIRYTMDELQGMGTFMLQDICAREKIMTRSAGIEPRRLNREALIQLLFRYRGRNEETLVDEFPKESVEVLSELLKRAAVAAERLEAPYKIQVRKDISLTGDMGVRVHHEFEGNYFVGALTSAEGDIWAVAEVKDGNLLISSRRICPDLQAGQYVNLQLLLFNALSTPAVIQAYNGQICDPLAARNLIVAKTNIPILCVVEAPVSEEPLLIDFGAAYTTSSAQGFSEVLNVRFSETSLLCPSVAAADSCQDGNVSFRFGYEALQLIRRNGYENNITFLHNLKLYLYEEKRLDICDGDGHAASISSDLVLKQFFRYIIARAKAQHGRNYSSLCFLLPEKRGKMALEHLKRLLPEYQIGDARCESVNSVYQRVVESLDSQIMEEPMQELVLHCGGGSTSLMLCRYMVENTQVSYNIKLHEQYLNGDSGFGGNHFTYLIMMYLKIKIMLQIRNCQDQILDQTFFDAYTYVDQYGGVGEIYSKFRNLYEEAEKAVPTKFRQMEAARLLKRQNFFRLWFLAENIKLAFFSGDPISIIQLPGRFEELCAVNAALPQGFREHRLDFSVHKAEIELLLAPEIYRIVKNLFEPLCNEYGILMGYKIRFTGMSCQLPMFRDALREFTVGRRARTGNRHPQELKFRALEGAIVRSKMEKNGTVIPQIIREDDMAPYMVTAQSHDGAVIRIISDAEVRGAVYGFIRRHIATREVEFMVCDVFGNQMGKRVVTLDYYEFEETGYEKLFESYPMLRDVQGDMDSIGEEEVRLFVFKEENWDFCVLPVTRKKGIISIDKVSRFLFDDESADYFCGLY